MSHIMNTPSPPRVKHSYGPSRYERETENRGEPQDERGAVKSIGEWRLGRTVGKGASGQVKIAKSMRTGEYAAVKIVPRHIMVASAQRYDQQDARQRRKMHEREERQRLTLEREIVIMKLIDHPNVISLLDVHEKDGLIYLVLEYVQGGELFEFLVSSRRFEANEASKYFQQIIRGLDYCHHFAICHRDLKPENIMLTAHKNIKIADFGMAAWQGSNQLLETSCGSPHYASPEIVRVLSYHGAASDIWSCGVILYALLVGTLPFDDKDMGKLLRKVGHGVYEKIPDDIPEDARDLIEKMLVVDPYDRITMRQIMSHPFFLRKDPSSDRYPVPIVNPPKLEVLSQPLKSASLIDPEILDNLCALWKGKGRTRIVNSLLGNEQCYEKVFYFLLAKHRNKRLEDYSEPVQFVAGGKIRKIARKPSTADVFSGQQHSRTRTRSGNGIQRLNSLREEHRPAPSPKRPFFKRNNATDDPRVAGELPDTLAKTSPQKRPLMGPRPLSLYNSPHTEGQSPTKGNQAATGEFDDASSPQPRSAPPLVVDFTFTGADAVQAQDLEIPDSPTPVSRRVAPAAGRRSDLPVLPEIQRQAFFSEQRPLNIQIDTDMGPMPSPGLPDDQYLDIFMKANPDGNPELDAYLRTTAFHVAAFRQFGTPLPIGPMSAMAPTGSFEAQQQEVLRDRSTEQFHSPVYSSAGESQVEVDQPQPTHPGGPSPDSVDFANDIRRASGSTTDTVFADAVEEIETLADNTEIDANLNAKRPAVKKKKSFIRRRSQFSGAESVDSQDETPRKRSRSAFDRALEFGSRKNTVSGTEQVADNISRTQNKGIEYIAPPLASPMEQESKTSFFKTLRFCWKGLRKVFVSQRDFRTAADECLRMLQGFRVVVDHDDHEFGTWLKCKVDSFRDPASGIIYEKQLRFRVDVRPVQFEDAIETAPSSITFSQERGSATVFKIVVERFQSEWFLDKLTVAE